MTIHSATFARSSSHWKQCPTDYPAIALIGRSNVGKSSLINALVGQRQLAKSSSTPGKTQLINTFLVNEAWYLVDLPGYGWAKISKQQREKWQAMTQAYFREVPNLVNAWVLLDGRLPPQANDVDFINMLGKLRVPLTLVLTKIDKCNQQQVAQQHKAWQAVLAQTWTTLPPFFATTAVKGKGIPQLRHYVEVLLESIG